MKHKKYSSIENSYREKFIGEIIKHDLNDGLWFVENKIHGSNFAFYINKDEIKVAKKSEFIGNDGSFYNHGKLVERHQEDLHKLFNWFSSNELVDEEIVVYGEIFGGVYPHPDVERVQGVKQVQKGIYYSPDIQFYAFDIMIDGELFSCGTKYDLFESFSIPYCKHLFQGSLSECLKFNEVFIDPVSQELGLPQIEGNYSEGVVIKPDEAKFFSTGQRVILKKKNTRYKEVEKSDRPQQKEAIELPENVSIHWNKISEFITENRLRNVISHIGQITQKDFGTLLKKFNEDILSDYSKDYDLTNLEKDQMKLLTKHLNNNGSKLIRANFLNIIDGVF